MAVKDKNILVVGELNIDLILNDIKGFPTLGQEILANDMNFTLGSSSAIFAANIATLGIGTAFSGMTGRDSFGKFIIDELSARNIDTSYIRQSDSHKTGITVIMNYGGDRANVTYGGAMEAFSITDVPGDIASFRHLHLSSWFLLKSLKDHVPLLFRKAREMGLSTSLDMQWDPDNKWIFPYRECLPHVDVFLPNESEILMLAGASSIEEAVEELGLYANTIIVKRGVKGALAYQNKHFSSSPPMLHDHFVDAIGAGDSFNAGFISKFLSGEPLERCLQFANLCGAINTTAAGGTAAFDSIRLFKQKAKSLFNIDL